MNKDLSTRITSLNPEQRELFKMLLRTKGISPDKLADALTPAPASPGAAPVPVPHTAGPQVNAVADEAHATGADREMVFSLMFFSGDGATTEPDKYRLILESARFADRHGFTAIWTPERHFQPFGGLYPNPSVLSAALAVLTTRLQLRAGSVVLPLQSPFRVAEEWSVVDNLSGGRVGVAFASGWLADDFVLAPEKYAARRESMYQEIETVKRLWRGETVRVVGGTGDEIDTRIFPNPIQPELPIWITASSKESFVKAGEIGASVLTGLMEQSIDDCAEKVALYRKSLERHGFDPGAGKVAVMLHTYIGEDQDAVREKVRGPFRNYLRTFLRMSEKQLAENRVRDINAEAITAEDQDTLLDYAFERYFNTSALFGTPATGQLIINRLRAAGVDEVACLLDFGLDLESILDGLGHLEALKEGSRRARPLASRP